MVILLHKHAALVVLLVSSAQLTSAARRTVLSMSVGLRAQMKAQQEDRRLLAEQEAAHLAYSKMSVDTAYQTLKQKSAANAKLLSLIGESLHANETAGLAQKYQPTAGIARARDMLNSMISETTRKLDTLKMECSSFFSKQCSLMETCRADISSSNSEAAEYRGRVLISQKDINICENRLPRLKYDLQLSIQECNKRLGALRRDLKIVLEDIDVMAAVLKLTECKETAMIQMEQVSVVECEHPCTKESFLTFHHEELNTKLASIKSSATRHLVQQGLAELMKGPSASVMPVDENGSVVVNVTVFKNEPLSQEPLPSDPCQGISYDAGGKSGCTLRGNPQCFNLQNKFINIQGEIVDKRDELLGEIHDLEMSCEATQKSLQEEIESYEAKHDTATSDLAVATGGENTAAQTATEKGEEHHNLEVAMFSSRKECSTKMRQHESELCALKKIRGELMKLKGDKHPFFQDCEVSKWEPEDCSSSCGGGIQNLKRGIVSPQSGGGAECPPLNMKRACNQHPCPIDCKVSHWTGFSSCSAACGGGVRSRMRRVKVSARYDGDPCGDLTETESCNMQDCSVDCKLGHWSKWSSCSKACGGGTKYSKKTVKVAAVGEGKCPSPKSSSRLKRLQCNTHVCPTAKNTLFQCKNKIDLVLLLDGSGSVRDSGWASTKQFASKFVEAFDGQDVQVSVILFSGPRTWTNYGICNGRNWATVDQEKICGMKMVQHFSNDTKTTKANIAGLAFPRSSTWTAKALKMADAELTLGRKDAAPVVLVMTDGVPISPRNTYYAAKKIKRKARLMFGAVRLSRRGLGYMQNWASAPKRDNVLRIRSFKDMAKIATMNALIRDMCSEVALR